LLMMTQRYKQLSLDLLESSPSTTLESSLPVDTNGLGNKLAPDDRSFHDWYRFVLSYPAHLVSYYLKDFGVYGGQVVLDPFCGTGTTLVEAKLNGFESVGIEANPMAHFASSVKVDWEVDPQGLLEIAKIISQEALEVFAIQGIDDTRPTNPRNVRIKLRTLDEEEEKLILENSISPLPLHKILVLRDLLVRYQDDRCYQHLKLALAKALVYKVSNLHFGPEVGVERPKQDISVVSSWLAEVRNVVDDLGKVSGKKYPPSKILLADARNISKILEPNSVDAVITSPPYPNEKDYTRTTRLELVVLGFVHDKDNLRRLKKNLVRSNTRGVYKEDNDDEWVSTNREIQEIAEAIERRRIELRKTSGFEKQYGRVTKLYFGGMARHLLELRSVLRPGAKLAYVVGDQASYLRVMIRTGQLLADIARDIGYDVIRIDLFRKRFATATKQELREEVVILQWKGH
jgi:DNA modification methylase